MRIYLYRRWSASAQRDYPWECFARCYVQREWRLQPGSEGFVEEATLIIKDRYDAAWFSLTLDATPNQRGLSEATRWCDRNEASCWLRPPAERVSVCYTDKAPSQVRWPRRKRVSQWVHWPPHILMMAIWMVRASLLWTDRETPARWDLIQTWAMQAIEATQDTGWMAHPWLCTPTWPDTKGEGI